MSIQFSCPECKESFTAGNQMALRVLECGRCGAGLRVPFADGPTVAEAARLGTDPARPMRRSDGADSVLILVSFGLIVTAAVGFVLATLSIRGRLAWGASTTGYALIWLALGSSVVVAVAAAGMRLSNRRIGMGSICLAGLCSVLCVGAVVLLEVMSSEVTRRANFIGY